MTANQDAATGWDRTDMAAQLAADIPEGWYVNLGIGLPTSVGDHIPSDREVIIHSENGVLGMGPKPAEDAVNPWLINAGKGYVTLVDGGCYVDHTESFAIIRGGHLDLCVLGAFEVAANGDFANWTRGGDTAPAVGGAMDLAVGAKRVWLVMEHTTRAGQPRLVQACRYPLTAREAVARVYTNLGVFDVRDRAFHVRRLAPGVTLDAVEAATGTGLLRP